MSQEFKRFQQVLSTKQAELETQARLQREKNEEAKKLEELSKKNFEKIANENRKIFENAGVVRLFQEIIDSRIVICSKKPLMSEDDFIITGIFGRRKWVKPRQILPYNPAKIRFSGNYYHSEKQYMNDKDIPIFDNTKVSLLFNERSEMTLGDKLESVYDEVSLYLTDDKKVGTKDERGKISEIEPGEIPEYIANQIAKTLH